MGTSLNALVAREHIADLQRAANGRGSGRAGLRLRGTRRHSASPESSARPAAAVRCAHADDAGTLRRIAQLDGAPELAGEILVATIGADVVAALSLDDGRVVANPFVHTADAVELLRGSATTLGRQLAVRHSSGVRRGRWSLRAGSLRRRWEMSWR
jgi:hypothetical protein